MKQEKRLQTIDGESLMNLPLQPLNFVVDSLLSQGLHVLAGSPKVGKSWLALWLAVTVAKGEPVWGMSVKPVLQLLGRGRGLGERKPGWTPQGRDTQAGLFKDPLCTGLAAQMECRTRRGGNRVLDKELAGRK